ncbi:CAZyme family CBM13 [Agaricus bisporus var. burnettii]|uniref:CAZyme family CBM13 n=1 Tax=Agaricus bisporus var. burnettii TaxID=192524 RepID=A0A8H7F288_AGABI|nr:CAZyme family CBM13 [Agaricus bisporus var. burnettii]
MYSQNFIRLATLLNVASVVLSATITLSTSTVFTATISSIPASEPVTTTISLSVPASSSPVTVTSSVSASSSSATTITSSVPATSSLPVTSTTTMSTPPPSGTPTPSFQIHPNGNTAKCLDVQGDIIENGTPVQIYDCNGTPAQNWIIVPGEGHVQLAATNHCLDAGATPVDGTKMKIWECFDNLPAQDWFYTDDHRISLTNQGSCLDLTEGNLTNGNAVQVWKCTDFNANQIWSVSNGTSGPA